MIQTRLDHVIEEIRHLELNELGRVERVIQERRETLGYSPQERKAMQALVDAGLMKEITPRCQASAIEHLPVPIQGKPLSETIIEERR